jgi:hypothetical protein
VSILAKQQLVRINRGAELPTTGCVLYSGKSPFVDAEDNNFVALMTFYSTNEKTGPMAQIYLLSDSTRPTDAKKLGLSKIVCGGCPIINLCYVNLGQGVQAAWKSYKNGKYTVYSPRVHDEYIRRCGVRFGAYGDPVLLPLEIVQRLASLSDGKWTGYTHQWEKPEYQAYRPYFMASVHDEITPGDDINAARLGWRYYRVGTDGPRPGEVLCPHDNAKLPYAVRCDGCFACDGANRAVGERQRVNIYTPPGGFNHAESRWANKVAKMQSE